MAGSPLILPPGYTRPPRPLLRQPPALKSPSNWSLQAPGIGIGILGGVAVTIWPQHRWIAYALFVVGAALIAWPVVSWAVSVIGQFVGIQPALYRRPTKSGVTKRILATAIVALLGISGLSGFAAYELVATRLQEQAAATAKIQERDRTLTTFNAFTASLDEGRALIGIEVKGEDGFNEWLLRLGMWQQRMASAYDAAITLDILTAAKKREFSLVQAGSVGPSFNARHGRERGHHFARLEVIQRHVDELKNAADELSR